MTMPAIAHSADSALTVAQALQLDILAGARLVAGNTGTQRAISWVFNVSASDFPNWLNGGELVITLPTHIPTAPDQQEAFFRAVAERGIVGMIVSIGQHLDEIPLSWCAWANALELPLISISYQERFIDIVRTLNEQIVQSSLTLVKRALYINQVLSRLVLDERGLQDVADELARLIAQSVSIENDRFDALASANIAEFDTARRYTLEHGRTNPLLLDALETVGILHQIRSTLAPVQIPKMPQVGLEMERILAPIVVHGEIYGYIWIIADGNPLSDLDRMAIESGATISALMMLHQEAVQSAEASLKGSLLSQLIQGDLDRERVLTDQALRYEINLHQPYRMVLLEFASHPSPLLVRVARRINRLGAEFNIPMIVGQFAGQVVILLSGASSIESATERMHQHLREQPFRLGVSGVHHHPQHASSAYGECREVLTIAQRLGWGAPTVYFDRLGYLHALYQAGESSLNGNAFVPLVRLLEREHGADLSHTLEVYLDLGGNGASTAKTLHIHRSTLNYRLGRIEQIIGQGLDDPALRTHLQVTLKLIRLFG